MATLTVQNVSRAGLTHTFVSAATGGDSFAPSKDTFLYVKNGGAGSITITLVTPKEAIADIAMEDKAVSVGAGVNMLFGPFPYEFFAQADDGLADVTYSGVTTVTVAAIKLKQP